MIKCGVQKLSAWLEFRNINIATQVLRRTLSNCGDARKTSLYDLHVSRNGKIVEFGGFLLPVQYDDIGINESCSHTRRQCSVFDVSHMLQVQVSGRDRVSFFESLCTTDIAEMADDSSALSLYTGDTGGIIDDLIVTKTSLGYIYAVSNATRRDHDMELLLKAQDRSRSAGKDVKVAFLEPEERALLSVQGPGSAAVLQPLVEADLNRLYFMQSVETVVDGVPRCRVTRCGYTGEDGMELSVPADRSQQIAESLLRSEIVDVRLAGLGARDSLRLEAGLCLYGRDIDQTTTPVAAGLTWTIGRRRRKAGDFPGAEVILAELEVGTHSYRVGLVGTSKGPPARTSCQIKSQGQRVGHVTSGCPSPTMQKNVAMGYVMSSYAVVGTELEVVVRDKPVQMVVTKMPFVRAKYFKKPK